MIPADRERLSQLLTEIAETVDDQTGTWYRVGELAAEARAIVDHPVDSGDIPNIIVKIKGGKIGDPITLTIAGTATPTPHPRPNRPGETGRPAKPSPSPSQRHIQPNATPHNPGRQPGTPSNGLGVVLP